MADETRLELHPGMSLDELSDAWGAMIVEVTGGKEVIFAMSPGTYRLPANWKLDGNNSPISFGVGGQGRELLFSYSKSRRELLIDTRLIGMSYTWRPLFP